jgi:hypothetical protein
MCVYPFNKRWIKLGTMIARMSCYLAILFYYFDLFERFIVSLI